MKDKNKGIEKLLEQAKQIELTHEEIRQDILNNPNISNEFKKNFKSIMEDNKGKSDIEMQIIRNLKETLDNQSDIEIRTTPLIFDPDTFMPQFGILINTDKGWRKSYTISINED